MRKKEKNGSKGITLIALIITIIVMLILVGVTIDVIIDGKLFDKAGEAVEKTNNKVGQTQNRVDELMGKLDEVENMIEMHNWTYTDETRAVVKCTCSECLTKHPSGLQIGQELNYIKTGTGSSTISGEKSGVSQGIIDGELTASDFGTNGDQTISKDSNTIWVVLGIEDSNNNGTNETLLLTTKTPTTRMITLYGVAGYNYVVPYEENGKIKESELDRICKELYGEEARSIKIEDVNNALGYEPAGGMYYDGDSDYTTGNFTTKLSKLPIWESIKAGASTNGEGVKIYYTPEHPEGTTDENELGKYELDGYWYHSPLGEIYIEDPADPEDTSCIVTEKTRTLVFGASNEYRYWLSSRGVYSFSDYTNFDTGVVDDGYAYSCGNYGLFCSDGYMCYILRPVRAVVPLRSEIPDTL